MHMDLQTRGGVTTLRTGGANAMLGYAVYLRDVPAPRRTGVAARPKDIGLTSGGLRSQQRHRPGLIFRRGRPPRVVRD
jgi:hypothetical protein